QQTRDLDTMPNDKSQKEDDWARWKDIIHDLYITKEKPLEGEQGVIQFMKLHHDFRKTKAQYTKKFQIWKFKKNITKVPTNSWQALCYKVEKRAKAGVQSLVYYENRPVPLERIRRTGYLSTDQQLSWDRGESFNYFVFNGPPADMRKEPFPALPAGFTIVSDGQEELSDLGHGDVHALCMTKVSAIDPENRPQSGVFLKSSRNWNMTLRSSPSNL
ncbi:hypothetical protein QBC35DRAFT_395302, partial [Podospora australis]